MSEKQFRNKVCFAAFFFSLMVVMIHSYNADMFLGASRLLSGRTGGVGL